MLFKKVAKMRSQVLTIMLLITLMLSGCSSEIDNTESNDSSDSSITAEVDEQEEQTESESQENDITDITELTQEDILADDIQICKNKALLDAGINEADVTIDKVVRYRSHHIAVCELIFHTGTNKYVYKIDLDTYDILLGKIVSIHDENYEDVSQDFISGDEALDIAVLYAKLSENEIKKQEAELKEKDGSWYYEVEVKTLNDKKYKFLISAASGDIIEFKAG